MTRPRTFLAVSVALAAAVYVVMWVGYCQNWAWLYRGDWCFGRR